MPTGQTGINRRREISRQMIDINAPEHSVEISWSADKSNFWVNVDGVCALRICRIPKDSLSINGKTTL